MLLKITVALVSVIAIFLVYVSTREGEFRYEVTGEIHAPVDKVFPYLSDLKLGSEWSPFERVDPNMQKDYQGNKLVFNGNKEAGSGEIEITNIVPNQSVSLHLTMTAPFKAENEIEYKVKEVNGVTHFTWIMYGDGGFLGKLMNVFIDCEKMVTDQFRQGIANLKEIVEGGAHD